MSCIRGMNYKYFPAICVCIFILPTVSFEKQTFKILMKSNLFLFSFIDHAWCHIRKLPNLRWLRFFPMFFLDVLVLWHFAFGSVIHFELIFLHTVWNMGHSSFVFVLFGGAVCLWLFFCSSTICSKNLSFAHKIAFAPLSESTGYIHMGLSLHPLLCSIDLQCNVWSFQFLHILANTYFLGFFVYLVTVILVYVK